MDRVVEGRIIGSWTCHSTPALRRAMSIGQCEADGLHAQHPHNIRYGARSAPGRKRGVCQVCVPVSSLHQKLTVRGSIKTREREDTGQQFVQFLSTEWPSAVMPSLAGCGNIPPQTAWWGPASPLDLQANPTATSPFLQRLAESSASSPKKPLMSSQ